MINIPKFKANNSMKILKWLIRKEVDVNKNIEIVDLEISKVEAESLAVCPYCAVVLEKFPKRKSKCKQCKNIIYLRTINESNFKKLLTESQMQEIDIEREKCYQNLERSSKLIEFGISVEDYKRFKNNYYSKYENKNDDADIFWPIFTELINRNESQSNTLGVNYYSLAIFFHQGGQDNFRLLQLSAKQTLDTYQQINLVQDFQIIAAKDCCDNCRKNDGINLTLEQAYLLPIPCSECTHSMGFCRCTYVAVASRDSEGMLIRKK